MEKNLRTGTKAPSQKERLHNDDEKMQTASFELWADRYAKMKAVGSLEKDMPLRGCGLSFSMSRYMVADQWQEGKLVNVKQITLSDSSASSIKCSERCLSEEFQHAFMDRTRRWQSLKHPSLPNLIDFCIKDMKTMYIVEQGMGKGMSMGVGMKDWKKLAESKLTAMQAVGIATQLCGLLIHIDEMIPGMVLPAVHPSQLFINDATIKVSDLELLYILGGDVEKHPEFSPKVTASASLAVALQLIVKNLNEEYKPLITMLEKLETQDKLSLVKLRADLRQMVSRLKVAR